MQVDVIQYAKQARAINKSIPVKQISKLEDLVAAGGGETELKVNLQFFMSDHGLPAVKGEVGGSLELTCQRCMSPIAHSLELELALLLLSQEQNMPDMDLKLEPYIYDSINVSLVDLISDDIVLSLPQEAKHADEACDLELRKAVNQDLASPDPEGLPDQQKQADAPNPFSELKSMLEE